MIFWELISKFNTIWKPFWHHNGIRNPLKSLNIALPRGIKNCSDFGIVFIEIWAQLGSLNHEKTIKKKSKIGVPQKTISRLVSKLAGSFQGPGRDPSLHGG